MHISLIHLCLLVAKVGKGCSEMFCGNPPYCLSDNLQLCRSLCLAELTALLQGLNKGLSARVFEKTEALRSCPKFHFKQSERYGFFLTDVQSSQREFLFLCLLARAHQLFSLSYPSCVLPYLSLHHSGTQPPLYPIPFHINTNPSRHNFHSIHFSFLYNCLKISSRIASLCSVIFFFFYRSSLNPHKVDSTFTCVRETERMGICRWWVDSHSGRLSSAGLFLEETVPLL